MHRCVFCNAEFANDVALVVHLVAEHKEAKLPLLDRQQARFRVYEHHQQRKIRCLCGERFTSMMIPAPAPYFEQWALDNHVELNSFVAHLRHHGGLEAHWRKLQDEALLERVERREKAF